MRTKSLIPAFVLGSSIIAIWQISCYSLEIQPVVLPSPFQIIKEIHNNFSSLLYHVWITTTEATLGFLLANMLSLALAISMIYIKDLDKAVMPLAIGLKTTPVVALAPLIMIWLGAGLLSKIFTAALICFFPMLVNTLKGFYSLQYYEEDLFNVYAASNTQILFKLRIYRAAPYIFSALKISSSLSIVGAIIGEFVGATKGIGYIILVSSYHLEIPKMFAAIFMAALVGITFYAIISYYDQKFISWVHTTSDEVQLESPIRSVA